MNILPIFIGVVLGGLNPKIRTLEETLMSSDLENVNEGNSSNIDD